MASRKWIHRIFWGCVLTLSLLCGAAAGRHGQGQNKGQGQETDKGLAVMAEKPQTEQDAADLGDADEMGAKKIALTFDDGPHPVYTLQLLDGLKERGAKATFFILGKNAEACPEVVQRISEDGHLIGNHTYSHLQYSVARELEFGEELVCTNEIIKEITGKDVLFVRPPYGSWNKKYESQLNMFPVLWTVDPLDWTTSNVDKIVSNVVTKASENDIILMHDYYQSTVTAALEIVTILQEEGYEFVTVDEVLFD